MSHAVSLPWPGGRLHGVLCAFGRRPAQLTERGMSTFGVFDRMAAAVDELSEHHFAIVDPFEVQLLCRVQVHELDG